MPNKLVRGRVRNQSESTFLHTVCFQQTSMVMTTQEADIVSEHGIGMELVRDLASEKLDERVEFSLE